MQRDKGPFGVGDERESTSGLVENLEKIMMSIPFTFMMEISVCSHCRHPYNPGLPLDIGGKESTRTKKEKVSGTRLTIRAGKKVDRINFPVEFSSDEEKALLNHNVSYTRTRESPLKAYGDQIYELVVLDGLLQGRTFTKTFPAFFNLRPGRKYKYAVV